MPHRSHVVCSIPKFAWCPMNLNLPTSTGYISCNSLTSCVVLRIANPWTALPSWSKCPTRGTRTLSHEEGLESQKKASQTIREGTEAETTAALVPSPKRGAARRSE